MVLHFAIFKVQSPNYLVANELISKLTSFSSYIVHKIVWRLTDHVQCRISQVKTGKKNAVYIFTDA